MEVGKIEDSVKKLREELGSLFSRWEKRLGKQETEGETDEAEYELKKRERAEEKIIKKEDLVNVFGSGSDEDSDHDFLSSSDEGTLNQ